MLPKEVLKQAIIERIKDIFWIYEERVSAKAEKPMVIAKDLAIIRNLEAARPEDIIKDFQALTIQPRKPQQTYINLMHQIEDLSWRKNRGYLKGTAHYEV